MPGLQISGPKKLIPAWILTGSGNEPFKDASQCTKFMLEPSMMPGPVSCNEEAERQRDHGRMRSERAEKDLSARNGDRKPMWLPNEAI